MNMCKIRLDGEVVWCEILQELDGEKLLRIDNIPLFTEDHGYSYNDTLMVENEKCLYPRCGLEE
jgi:hypothetical protein